MRHFFSILFILTHSALFAQITDDFSDGDFTSNPLWSGTDTHYTVNGSFQLQLNNTLADTSYLSTPHGLTSLDNREWNLWVRQAFSPSGGNYGRVYLTSSNADLTADPDGFYLQFGEAGSNDAVRLFKAESGLHTELLAGPLAQIATSFAIRVRVVRDNIGNWDMYIDDTGGTNYTLAGSVNDATALLGTHFGVYDLYTVSNATDFYYDDIYVGNEIVDITPPVLLSAVAINDTSVDVFFDEPLDQTSAENIGNYNIIPFNSVSNAALDGMDPTLVHLTTASVLLNGNSYQLTTNNIADAALNLSGAQSVNFTFLVADTAEFGDVIINEFMCDPSPPVFLPDLEYVEIYNRSSKVFDLSNWTLSDNATSGTIQTDWLLPGEYRVLCATASTGSFFNAVGVTSFAGLNNAGDAIVLKSNLGVLLDSINYTDQWYQDPAKEDGGYSIELINPDDPCSDASNWIASNDIDGGTPGEVNSVYDLTPDIDAPFITTATAFAPNLLNIEFNERVDSTSVANTMFSSNPVLTIQSIDITEATPSQITIHFNENLAFSTVYNIQLEDISDCWLNLTDVTASFVLAETGSAGDLVINEIMFNPLTGGSDWVEIYNRSDKVIDLFNWQLANFDNDTIANQKPITDPIKIHPDDYLVLTEDSTQILQDYPAAITGKYYVMDLPSYNNDSSTVYLLQDNTVRDKVSYSEDWHFQLVDDVDGKSLERIDTQNESDESSNWHTAAEAVGFATPGGENSQYRAAEYNGEFNYTSNTVSPDNDGFEDVLQINYEFVEPGYLGTFTIFDDRGRLIRVLMKNELLGKQGSFTWDGLRDDGTKASIGTYVGVFETFSIQGALMFTKKKVFTVAGKI